MKFLIGIMTLVLASTMAAADTVHVPAREIVMMFADYLDRIYSYDELRRVRETFDDDIEADDAIYEWRQTDEGAYHSLAQTSWEEKYQSFVNMFPPQKLRGNHFNRLKYDIMLSIRLFRYANGASIVVVGGQIDAIIFYNESITEPHRWVLGLDDEMFRVLYETASDDDGVPWRHTIQRLIGTWNMKRRTLNDADD